MLRSPKKRDATVRRKHTVGASLVRGKFGSLELTVCGCIELEPPFYQQTLSPLMQKVRV